LAPSPSGPRHAAPPQFAAATSPADALQQFIASRNALPRRDLRALLRQAAPAQIRELLALNEANPRFTDRGWVRRTLLERWAASAPVEALQWTEGLGRLDERVEAAAIVCNRWSETAPRPAAAAAWDLRRPQSRMAALRSVISVWTRAHPEDVRAWVYGAQDTEQHRIGRTLYHLSLSATAPEQALREGSERNNDFLVARAMDELASQDPVAALRAIDALPTGVQRDQATGALVGALARTDPTTACDLALATTTPSLRRKLLATAGYGYAESDPQNAVAWIQAHIEDANDRGSALRAAAETLARTAPAAAAAVVATMDGAAATYAAREVAKYWTAADPTAALAWARQLPTEGAQSVAASAIVEELFQSDPSGALATMQSSFPDSVLAESYSRLGWLAGQHGAATSLALLGQMREGPAKTAFIGALATELAGADTSTATALLDQLPPGAARTSATVAVAQAWRDHDPAAAASWAFSLPESPARADAMAAVVNGWINVDVSAVADWLRRLPSGPSRDRALSTAIAGLAQTTPATAAAWVARLPSGENRRNAILAVAETWLQQDRTAALRWLATSDLPAEEQARLANQERGAP
jgi:hypothetical protein